MRDIGRISACVRRQQCNHCRRHPSLHPPPPPRSITITTAAIQRCANSPAVSSHQITGQSITQLSERTNARHDNQNSHTLPSHHQPPLHPPSHASLSLLALPSHLHHAHPHHHTTSITVSCWWCRRMEGRDGVGADGFACATTQFLIEVIPHDRSQRLPPRHPSS